MTVDLRPIKMTGKKACAVLEEVNITTNKNAIPNDPEKPMVTSGIRLGTPAVTTRGFNIAEMTLVGQIIGETLKNPDDESQRQKSKKKVEDLCKKFPLYESKMLTAR